MKRKLQKIDKSISWLLVYLMIDCTQFLILLQIAVECNITLVKLHFCDKNLFKNIYWTTNPIKGPKSLVYVAYLKIPNISPGAYSHS